MPVESFSVAPEESSRTGEVKSVGGIVWINVVLGALLMLATLPGRTQGLGLITEPMLADLHLDRITYAKLNLWATLLGAAGCFPAGWLLDRCGLRWTSGAIVLLLGGVVWQMSAHPGGVTLLFLWLLLTRALGQSALSVASITAVAKSTRARSGLAMGVYSVLLSILFAAAFVLIGSVVSKAGWRIAWQEVALALVLGVAPLVLLFLREPAGASEILSAGASPDEAGGTSLSAALRTPAFWIFGVSTALFGLVSSGLGLFNEAVLAERGFDQQTFHNFLAVTTLFALVGQLLCGWLSLRRPMTRLLGFSMFLYAASLLALPFLRTLMHLWVFAAVIGLAAGMITVIFFAIWGHAFGRAHVGRIQGAAQMLTVLASAIGPLLFAQCHAAAGSYAPVLFCLSPVVLIFGLAGWRMRLQPRESAALAVS